MRQGKEFPVKPRNEEERTLMRLESALRTSKEGMTAHGQAIAVIGDNISNANTTGFKEQRVEFRDILSDKVSDRGTEVVGGIGDGVSLGRVRLDFENGAINATGRDLDVALTGRGFFLAGEAASPLLTRGGNFQINDQGILVTSDGLPVLGYSGLDTVTLGTIRMDQLDTQIQPTTLLEVFANIDASSQITPVPANAETFRDLNGDAAFASTHSIYDATGARRDIQLYYFKTGIGQWTVQAYVNGADVGQAAEQPVLLGQTNLTFAELGQIPDEQQAQAVLALNPQWADAGAASTFTISLSNLTQFAGGSRVTNVRQDGRGNGDVVGFDITNDGKVFGILNTGDRIQAGTLAIGTVNNFDGLERQGGGYYATTVESGQLNIGQALIGGRGGMEGKALETSNVDISDQFVSMIVFQRGYQANSQVLSTASDMMKNTIAMIR